jgi:hypothetical protein
MDRAGPIGRRRGRRRIGRRTEGGRAQGMRLSCFLLLAALTGCAGREISTHDFEEMRDGRVAALTARATPESLATASVLLGFKRDAESLVLIDRAAALAPQRPEILYLQWRACASQQCPQEARNVADLKSIDPGNGIAWFPELSEALDREDQREVTHIVEIIGASRQLTFYWNKTVVMMVDALGDITPVDMKKPMFELSTRIVMASGLLAALSIPPMQSLAKACRMDQFEEPGRRSACQSLALRLRQSDEMIFQSLGMGFQTRWSAEGSAERESLKAQRRQYDYLLLASSKERLFHMNKDAATRLDAMRRSTSETDVVRAMLISFHEPLERPLNWKDPLHASE